MFHSVPRNGCTLYTHSPGAAHSHVHVSLLQVVLPRVRWKQCPETEQGDPVLVLQVLCGVGTGVPKGVGGVGGVGGAGDTGDAGGAGGFGVDGAPVVGVGIGVGINVFCGGPSELPH